MPTASTRQKGRTPPPRRGVPYYDAVRGVHMIVPHEGGRARQLRPSDVRVAKFSAKDALRRSGLRAGAASDRAARRAPGAATRAARRAGGTPQLGVTSTSSSGFVIYLLASLVGLIVLESILGGRGPAAVSTGLGWLGGAINRLVSPNDPLVSQGTLPGVSGPVGTPTSSPTPAAPTGLKGPVGKPTQTTKPAYEPRGNALGPVK